MAWTSGALPVEPLVAWPKGMTTIIGTALPSATKLSMIQLARPACVQPRSKSFAP